MFHYWCCVPASRQSLYWRAQHHTLRASRELLVTPHILPAFLATITDNPHESVMLITREWPQGQLQIDTRGSQWLTPAPVSGAGPGKSTSSRWIVQAPHLPAPDPCISCSPVAPIRREPFSNPTLSWALKAKTSCLFANFCCFSMFWKMWTGFLQPGFIYSRPNHLTFCKQFCFGGWMKCIYLAAQATWVATAKQRNYLCSQQGEGTANYAILDKYQLSEHVLLTPRPVSFLPSFQSKMLKYLKKGTFQGDFTFIITAIRFQLEKRH